MGLISNMKADDYLLGSRFLITVDLIQIVWIFITAVFFLLFYVLVEGFHHQVSPLTALSDGCFYHGKLLQCVEQFETGL